MTTDLDMSRKVEVQVLGSELHKGKPMIKLEVPAWGSKYPIPIYGATPEEQKILAIGETMGVELKADRQKPNTDGSKPWDYYWSFVRRLSGDEAGQLEAAQPPQDEQSQQAEQSRTFSAQDREMAIRRAVALKAAVDLHGGGAAYDGVNLPEVLEVADRFDEWLRGEET